MTDPPISSGTALMDEGFGVYWCWGEIPLGEEKEFVTNFVLTCDDQASFSAPKCVTYLEGNATSVAVALEVDGGNIVTCTQDNKKLRSQNNAIIIWLPP